MELMDAAEPGYGGFLPWFCSRGATERGGVDGAESIRRGVDEQIDKEDAHHMEVDGIFLII